MEYVKWNVLLLQHSKFINKFKIYTSMKKLMALLVVAGMTFVACGNKTAEEAEPVQDETMVEAEAPVTEEEAAPAPEEAPVEEAAETPAE
ncbi:MAG: hypothetical protein IIU04_06865 [Bacteroidales bacterium]|nr:hypothetical protein [Bacteroidales bacterium]